MNNLFLAGRLPAALSCALLTAACTKVESSDVTTAGLYAELSVTASGDGMSLAKAALKVGGGVSNTFVDLTAGDMLTATGGGTMRAMQRRELAGAVTYEVELPTDMPGAAFTIALARGMGTSAPDSQATLPAPFAVSEPAANVTISRARDALRMAWTPSGSGDSMRWTLAGECIVPAAGDVSGDTGSVVIEAGRILPLDAKAGVTCPVTMDLVRTRTGTVSSAYGKGGRFHARQRRVITIRSAP